jgi:HEAT repeat protein
MSDPLKPQIEKLLRGEEFDRLNELVALGTKAVPTLVEILQQHPDADMRARAAVALGLIGDKQAVPMLKKALDTSDPQQKVSVIEALGKLAGAEATEELVKLLNDPDPSVLKVAVRGLAEVGNKTAIAALETLHAGSTEDFMRKQAEVAISEIRGRIA